MAAVRTYLAQGKTKEAQAFINSVLATNPKNFEAKLLQGQVYSLSGEKLNAYAAFEEAILINPKNPAGYQQLAVANIKASDFDLAEANIGKGLIAVPNNFGLKITLAEIYELKKDYKKAIIAYESVLKDRPDSEIAQNNYVSLISDYQDDEASLKKAYDVAQKLKSSDVPQFQDTLGWISYKMNKHDEAIAALKEAIEKLPKTSIFHYHLGKATNCRQKIILKKLCNIIKINNPVIWLILTH
jgi:Tfp pilus assembly protein PilF